MAVRLAIVALVSLGIGAAAGILGYTWLVGGDGEASEPITAPTLDVNALPTLNPTQSFAALTQVADLSNQVTNLQATIAVSEAQQTTTEAQAAVEPTAEATKIVEEAAPAASERVLYRIVPEESTVTFTLQEDLRGNRIDVIGTTTDVAGDVVIDFSNPAASQIGTIRINARTLTTDQQFRNRALRAEILRSAQDQYEYIEFVPTALNGLPESVTIGETYTVEIVGDLTIISTTNPVTFTAQVTVNSETQISGSASATILYADWGIRIPNAPGVANVTDDVTLAINFTANQVEE